MFEETILYQHKASFPHLTVISGHDLHSFQLNGEQTFGRISRRGTPDLWVHSPMTRAAAIQTQEA